MMWNASRCVAKVEKECMRLRLAERERELLGVEFPLKM